MADHLRTWLERTGLTRPDVPGLVVAILGAVLAVLLAFRLPLSSAAVDAVAGADSVEGPTAPVITPAPSEVAGPLLVHVTGAVVAPGLVELAAGARVADAVAAAGGASDEASLGGLNLARPVVDGEQVRVPTVDEVAAGTVVVPTPTTAAPTGILPDGRVDLATATASQLEELPGIGPVLAARIIAHRDEVGGFDDAVALREVAGIGEATWAELRDLVGVAGDGS